MKVWCASDVTTTAPPLWFNSDLFNIKTSNSKNNVLLIARENSYLGAAKHYGSLRNINEDIILGFHFLTFSCIAKGRHCLFYYFFLLSL